MTDETQAIDLNEEFKNRFQQLPKAVQDAIMSADVSQHLRTLADGHKMHLDQWQMLENEVMLVLLGFDTIENLPHNLQKEIGIDAALATELSASISQAVFAPIRAELERVLKEQHAQTTASGTLAAAPTTLSATTPPAPIANELGSPVAPGTPPTPAPDSNAVRAPVSDSYHAPVPSTERRGTSNDPYREQLG
jgi:hypothetical protein